jgi:ABC-type glycerol-3-phosphate transport system substrate-binding protein
MKTMVRTALLLSCVGWLVTGCGGGGAELQASSTTTTTTIGQELLDLDRARQQGIIDESEYRRAKRQILERYEQ